MNILQFQSDNANIKRHGRASHLPAMPNRNRSDEERVMASKEIRPIRVEGNLAYVPLTRGYEAVIDAADAYLVAGVNWNAFVTKHTVYARRTSGRPARREVLLHRVIMGDPEGVLVDHADCNGLNNRRANLRQATPSQNAHNMRLPKDNKSGFKGVSWHRPSKRWMAEISANRRKHYLGIFRTREEAHDAYMAASAKLHGDFGRAL